MKTPKFHWWWEVQLVQDIGPNHTAVQSVEGPFRTKNLAESAGREAQKLWPAFNRLIFRRPRVRAALTRGAVGRAAQEPK